MKDFNDLIVWQRNHAFTLRVYAATKSFPKGELFGLTSQMRRSTSSAPTNIAEGCGRHGDVELARFFQIAMGSASETEYQLRLAYDLGCLADDAYSSLLDELTQIKRMLNTFIQKLRPDRISPKS